MSDDFNLPIPNSTIDKAYDDLLHPAAAEMGKILKRIPAVINAACASIDMWVFRRTYNVEKIEHLLASRMPLDSLEKIVPPNPYVLIPALQYISYSISSDELFDLYANLLSKAMYDDTKEKVHPSFVEIIKQLSPVDALVLKKFANSEEPVAAAMLSIRLRQRGLHIVGQSSSERAFLECVPNIHISGISEDQILVSVDNLKRLGLVSLFERYLLDVNAYDFVKESHFYKQVQKEFDELSNADSVDDSKQSEFVAESISTKKHILTLTPIGNAFCDICVKGLK